MAKPGGRAHSFWNWECTTATDLATAKRKEYKRYRYDETWLAA